MTGSRLWTVFVVFAAALCAQDATLSGLILDPSNASVSGAEVSLRNEQTGGRRMTSSSAAGFYSFASLKPGEYRLSIRAPGFETTIQNEIRLEVGDAARLDFNLRIGDDRTEVTVHAGSPMINTENASVGTVIDRSLIDQMPLNGRGIQSLIELSPGVVVLPVASASAGQFAINGQRTNANYFTVDGVSANFAISIPLSLTGVIAGPTIGTGMIPANNFFGTLSNLVAPESLQEFRIQTSTFAPEFGRSPGGQVGLVTRSGTNRYSGSLFEYFRNDKTDASDWFANSQASPKPPLRFNNFGGVFGGPVRVPHLYEGRDRTFFFVSVDELLTSQPQPPFSFAVPTLEARQSAPPLVAQLLRAYPLPNRPPGAEDVPGFAEYAASYSLYQNQHSFSLRGDHMFNERWTLFARYSRASSERLSTPSSTPSVINKYNLATETLTFGLTHIPTPHLVQDVRLNASRQVALGESFPNEAEGSQAPPDSLLFPSGYSTKDSQAIFAVSPAPYVQIGRMPTTRARQLQFVDQLTLSRGAHQLKAGVDYRWYSPEQSWFRFQYSFGFPSLESAVGGIIQGAEAIFNPVPNTAFIQQAFSAYIQDTWKASRKLTMTYGLRWEVAPGPRVSVGEAAFARGFPGDPLDLVPAGKSGYRTTWSNVAPRWGLAWQALDHGEQKTVVRLGAGTFFDLGQTGMQGQGQNGTYGGGYLDQPLGSPTGGIPFLFGPNPVAESVSRTVAPDYKLPYTWQWNATVEQSIGKQSLSAAYIGALGRRLASWAIYPMASGSAEDYLNNDSKSSYHAMQLQFNRRLSSSLHMLVSYTWSHSIDDLSTDAPYSFPGGGPTSLYYDPRRKGSSDFDIRHALNGSIIAELPSPRGTFADALLHHWTATSIFFARSALPTDILADNYVRRPDVLPGQPLYLYGPEFPGGKSFNLGAFTLPPAGRDGNFGRNVLRGLGARQIDFSLHRDFTLAESVKLQFRAEIFNLFNHPNFANPSNFSTPGIFSLNPGSPSGAATKTLAYGLSPLGVLGGLSPLFQIGGPRSMQFALRLGF